jgi:uncharacterized membrane protein
MNQLIFLQAGWFWIAAILLLVTAGLLIWGYRPMAVEGSRWIAFFLKALGITALIFCLLEPFWSGTRARPGENTLALVVDNSLSLQVKDAKSSRSRLEELRALVSGDTQKWQAVLADNFELRKFLFDAQLQSTEDFHELTGEGPVTALGRALQTLGERYRGRPLAGILLFTDGNATDLTGNEPDWHGLPPVYPVVIGQRDSLRDLSVQQISVSQTPFEDAPVSIQADVLAVGFAGETVVAQLSEAGGKLVNQQSIRVTRSSESVPIRFQARPEREGILVYRVQVAAQTAGVAADGSARSSEATLANNSRLVVVKRDRGPYRILYVSGRPNWEYKFLNRALQDDPQLQLTALIRVARREPKFDFRGRPGETANPLFRGFANQTREEVERYDQPVLIRLNLRDESELQAGFPLTPEELYPYHAVIIDDLEAEFFKPDQAALLQKFVSERGGGVLMLGGMESFQQGQYLRTPVGDMLPVYLDATEAPKLPGPVRMNLSREGWLQPWARIRQQETDEKTAREKMPPFQVLNPVRGLKPGASLITTVKDENGQEYPALAVQRFGRGRTAALLVGDFWRWGMQNADAHRDFDQAWRQFMRWLVADVPPRVELTVEPVTSDASGAIRLQARVRDQKFQPLDNVTVQFEIQELTAANTNSEVAHLLRLPPDSATDEAGLFQATYIPRFSGAYRAQVVVTNASGIEEGRSEAGWTTDLQADELKSLVPNVSRLENLARKTGGEVIAADRLTEFARNLPLRKAPIQEAWSYPLWHTPLLFGLALLCFVGEWGLRRWKGWP